MSPGSKALLATVATLVLVEGALRVTGRGPWRPFEDLARLPRLSEADPTLGWIHRQGTFEWDGNRVSVGPLGRAHLEAPGADGTVGVFGGSYVYGFGVDDTEVCTRLWAEAHPELDVRNLGVPGYGTLQSMLASRAAPTDTVVYGLVELHDGRNVGAWSWLHALERSARGQSWGAPPSAVWDGSVLHQAPPRGYQHWAWSERVALVDLTERTWIGLHDRFLRTKAETTVQLVAAWRNEVEARGGRFVVALLEAPTRHRHYLRRFGELGIQVVDLRLAEPLRLPDGHPSAAAHRRWATALQEAL